MSTPDHQVKPYIMRMSDKYAKIKVETDGTRIGTLVTDISTGKMLPVSKISFSMDFSKKDEARRLSSAALTMPAGDAFLELDVVCVVSISAHPTRLQGMLLQGCPNPECEYHERGYREQQQRAEDQRLPEDLQPLAARLSAVAKIAHQGQLDLWDAFFDSATDMQPYLDKATARLRKIEEHIHETLG